MRIRTIVAICLLLSACSLPRGLAAQVVMKISGGTQNAANDAFDAMSLIGGIAGPEHERTTFAIDPTNTDGLFNAGAFEILSEDTGLVTGTA